MTPKSQKHIYLSNVYPVKNKQTDKQKNNNKQTKQPSIFKPVYMKENFWLLRKTNFYQVNDKQILLIVKWRPCIRF